METGRCMGNLTKWCSCTRLELCSRRISRSHAFWCFPRPILAIANPFLFQYRSIIFYVQVERQEAFKTGLYLTLRWLWQTSQSKRIPDRRSTGHQDHTWWTPLRVNSVNFIFYLFFLFKKFWCIANGMQKGRSGSSGAPGQKQNNYNKQATAD